MYMKRTYHNQLSLTITLWVVSCGHMQEHML